MQAYTLVGISGKIRSGKSTTSNAMISYDNRYVRKSFATKLKQVASTICNFDIRLCDTQEGKNTEIEQFGTVRNALQVIGTHLRELDPDIWVNALLGEYKQSINPQSADDQQNYWIIDDVRFPNEKQRIEELGGIVIRLTRESPDYHSLPEQVRAHISETALDHVEFDHYAPADQSADEIARQILEILNSCQ